MDSDWIKVTAPPTVANLGPGYDILGLALDAPGDTVRARRTTTGVHLRQVTGNYALPPAGAHNTASIAATLVLERLGNPFGVELELHKGLPIGSGLGSSGASAVAAAFAVNLLGGSSLSLVDLIEPCALAEKAACGSPHADNVAPALLGGITLVRSQRDVTCIKTRLSLALAVISPEQELKTRDARRAIPEQIPAAEAIYNSAHLASLVYALATDDEELIRCSLSDHIAEPRRAHLINGFAEVKQAALDAGALGASIAGAGPAIFALCASLSSAEAASMAMSDALKRLNHPHKQRVARISLAGAHEVRP